MNMFTNEESEEEFQSSFGKWITGMWTPLPHSEPIEKQKEAFFWLLEKWLREGKVKFCAPDADVYIRPDYKPKYTINDPEAQWHAPPEEIIAWLKERWPKDVTDINDVRLIHYFFNIPGIIWVDQETGKLYGS